MKNFRKKNRKEKILNKAIEIISSMSSFIVNKFEDQPTLDEGEGDFNNDLTVINDVDLDKRLITGVVLEPEIVDSQGDIISADDIEKACFDFMMESQQIGLQHQFKGPAKIVENWISKDDCMLGEQLIRKGTWLMTVKIDDSEEGNKVWDLVKQGKITGFSIGGTGEVEDAD